MMRQTAPDPELLAGLLKRLKYKEGWTFTLADTDRDQGSEGLTLIINIRCRDTYNTARIMSVNHYMIVPPASYDERSWCRWLLEQILLVEQHEACEFYQIGALRPYAPNHAPGNNPYTLFDQGTREGAELDYRGDRKVPGKPEEPPR